MMYEYFSPLIKKEAERNILRELEMNYIQNPFACRKRSIVFYNFSPPFSVSQTPLQKRVQCLGERLKTLKMQMLVRRYVAVNHCNPETPIAHTSSCVFY